MLSIDDARGPMTESDVVSSTTSFLGEIEPVGGSGSEISGATEPASCTETNLLSETSQRVSSPHAAPPPADVASQAATRGTLLSL
jgi:hypothetical protein